MKIRGFLISHQINSLLFIVALFLSLSLPIYATNWYVYKNASGSNNGTSWTNAWKSFSNINWSSIQPGDYIYISGGTDSLVYSGSLSPNKSGTKANRIRIWAGKYSPNPSGHSGRVIIEGGSYNIHIQNASYLWVKGLELRNANSHAVNIEDNSTGIIIDSLNIYQFNAGGGDGYGIRLTALADSTVIQYCTIKDRIDGVGQSDVIQINYWNQYRPTRTIIHDNFLHCRSQDPVAHNDVLQSVACDGFIIYNNILISDSVNSGTEGGGMPFILSSINWGGDNPVIIFNNFAYMGGLWYPNANYGNTFYTRHDGPGNSGNQPSKVFVFNNAFISNGPRNSVFQQEYLAHFVSNNIFASYCPPGNDPQGRSWRNHSAHGWHSVFGGSTAYGNHIRMDSARYNLVWKEDSVQSGLFAGQFIKPGGGTQSFSNWSQWVAAGGTGLNRDPLFVSNFGHEPDQSLLRPDLKPNSPAIDAGEDLTYLYNYFKNTLGYDLPEMLSDFYGNPRGENWSIGAYEYDAGPDLTPPRVTGASLLDSVTLVVNFSEALDQATAENKSNYSITNNINVLNASLSGTKVTLQTSPHSPGSYVVTVVNVEDLSGNSITQNNTAQYILLPPDTLMKFPIVAVEGIIIEPDHTPEKTIDGLGALSGDPDSRWAAEPMPEELTFDLGTIRTVCKTRLSFYNWNAGRYYDYSISISTDHNNWITVIPQRISVSNEEWTVDEFTSVEARYVRVHFINNNQSPWAGLWEAEIWGSDATIVDPFNNNLPSGFTLGQNYPNPFNPSTTINYSIPSSSFVTIIVYDILGKKVATLVNEEKPMGSYEIEFSADGGSSFGGEVYNLTSGIYFYRLQAGSFVETKKMIYLK